MSVADKKLIDLDLLAEAVKHIQGKIPVYTTEEYQRIKNTIPKGTFFSISDDTIQASDMIEMQVTSEDISEIINEEPDSSESKDPEMDEAIGDLFKD